MPRDTPSVPATPAVLRWAREDRKMTLLQAAREIGITAEDLESYETGEDVLLPTSVFRGMLKAYGRTESVLLLPAIPPLPAGVIDKRGARRRGQAPLLQTILSIREGQQIQEFVSELVEDDPALVPQPERAAAEESDNAVVIATRERARIGVTIEEQRRHKPHGPSLTFWRSTIQAQGILVLSKDMPREDCRGVSLNFNGLIPVIIVTTQDSYAGRIFTLLHEYAHVLRRTAAFCAVDEADDVLEHWCEAFAASFLMPERAVRDLMARKRFAALQRNTWTLADVKSAASWFRVSPFAMAIRLLDLGLSSFVRTNGNELRALDQIARRHQDERRRADQRAGIPTPLKAIRELGTTASSAVLDAWHQGIVDRREVAAITGVPGNQISAFEERFNEQRLREAG